MVAQSRAERKETMKTRKMTEQEQLLVEKNYQLIYFFLNANELEERDYYDTVAIALCHAAMTYSKEQGEFDQYAYLCMENAMCTEQEKMSFYTEIPQEELVSYSFASESAEQEEMVSFAWIEDSAVFKHNFSVFVKQLDQETKKVVQMFAYGYKQAEIADALGCTQSCISRVRKKLADKWQRCTGSKVRSYGQSF